MPSVSRCVGDRQSARAGRRNLAVLEDAAGTEVGDRPHPAAVGVQHVRLGLIGDAVAVDVARDRRPCCRPRWWSS